MRRAAIAAFLAVLIASSHALAQDRVRGEAHVIDGDTIEVAGTRIRLHGIDAPETGQSCNNPRGATFACGTDAATLLGDLIRKAEVTCVRAAKDDRYGRMIAVCRAGGRNLNAEMVSRGMAWAYREYSTAYAACEADARKRGVGIWQAQQSQAPWEYRRDVWNDALQIAPAGRPIKANFRRKGECIYQTPWSRSYLSLKNMSPPNRWLATEAEAIALGCRPPKHGTGFRLRKRLLPSVGDPKVCPN